MTSEPHRQPIREDVLALAEELITPRQDLTITVRFHLPMLGWQELPVAVELENVLLIPAEFKDGHPWVQLGTEEDPTNFEKSDIVGMREFLPDYATLLKQVPLLGNLIVAPIPRSGSAIMLANILQVALLVSDGVPGLEARHAALASYYTPHRDYLLQVMRQHIFLNDCWHGYYSFNITFEPFYSLLQLESDPARKTQLHQQVLSATLWPLVKDHKNSFFNYIWASAATAGPERDAALAEANRQLERFPPPPKAHISMDNSSLYPAHPDCENLVTEAIDVD